jgi:hypothetical protein
VPGIHRERSDYNATGWRIARLSTQFLHPSILVALRRPRLARGKASWQSALRLTVVFLECTIVDDSAEDLRGSAADNEASGNMQEGPRRNRISLATALVVVAAIGAECALVVQIRRCYEAIPSFASPACPEWQSTPLVLLWIVLGSLAAFAWRKCSVDRLAIQVAISCVLVMSRLSVPTRNVPFGTAYDVFWPVLCFALFFVGPYLLVRFSRVNDSVLVLADSAVVALLTYIFAIHEYVPRL